MKPFNARSNIIKTEHVNDTFITPVKNIHQLGKWLTNKILGNQKWCIVDFSCGSNEHRDNIYNNIKSYFNESSVYFGSDIKDFEITKNIDKNVTYLIKEIDKVNINKYPVIIIMNPPYSMKDIFIETTLALQEHYKIYACIYFLLLPTSTMSGLKRSKMWGKHVPYLLSHSRRVQFIEGKSSNLDISWFYRNKDKLYNGIPHNMENARFCNEFIDLEE